MVIEIKNSLSADLFALNIDFVRNNYKQIVARALPGRRKTAAKFHFEADRLRCLGAGFLLQEILGVKNDEDLIYGKNGKPEVLSKNGAKKYFNLSHSGDYIVLATGAESIGVDIEKICPYDGELAKLCFLPQEIDYINRSDFLFYKYWTIKESLMKATGEGLSLPPLDILLTPENTPVYEVCGIKWITESVNLGPDHIISVAMASSL